MKCRPEKVMHEFVGTRVLVHEKQALAQAAERRGVSMSDFTRQAIAEAVQRVAA